MISDEMNTSPRKIKDIIVISACCLSLTACAPFKVEIGRRFDGSVVDSRTAQPVPGAEVMYRGHAQTKVLADQNGKFHLDHQAVIKWLPLIPMDYFGWQWHPLLIRANGYKSAEYQPTREAERTPIRIDLTPKP